MTELDKEIKEALYDPETVQKAKDVLKYAVDKLFDPKKYGKVEHGDMILKEGLITQRTFSTDSTGLKPNYPIRAALISSPADVAQRVEYMEFYDREFGTVLHLDSKNRIVGTEIVSIGSLNAAIVHPREVYKKAVLSNSSHIIFIHNHPSGDPTPSREDNEITKKLAETGAILGISLLDSMVIGRGGKYYSFKEAGKMPDLSDVRAFDPALKRCEPSINAALERKGIEPDTVDVAALIDSELTCKENEKAILKEVGASKTKSHKDYGQMAEQYYRGQGKLINARPDVRAAAFAQMREDGTLRGYDPKTPREEAWKYAKKLGDTPEGVYTRTYLNWFEGQPGNLGYEPDYASMGLGIGDHKEILSHIGGYLRTAAGFTSDSLPNGLSKQKQFEKENKAKAHAGKKLKGQQTLTSAVSTSKRLSDFGLLDPGTLTIKGDRKKMTRLAKHLQKEHPSTKGKMKVLDPKVKPISLEVFYSKRDSGVVSKETISKLPSDSTPKNIIDAFYEKHPKSDIIISIKRKTNTKGKMKVLDPKKYPSTIIIDAPAHGLKPAHKIIQEGNRFYLFVGKNKESQGRYKTVKEAENAFNEELYDPKPVKNYAVKQRIEELNKSYIQGLITESQYKKAHESLTIPQGTPRMELEPKIVDRCSICNEPLEYSEISEEGYWFNPQCPNKLAHSIGLHAIYDPTSRGYASVNNYSVKFPCGKSCKIPTAWYDAMVLGIKKSSDVRNPYAIVKNIWAKLSSATRQDIIKRVAKGERFNYNLPLPDDRVTKGQGTLRMVRPFKLAEAQVNVSKKDMEAVKKSGIFRPMKREDGSICQVARCKGERPVNIFVDEV